MSQYKLIYNQLLMTQEVKYDEYGRPTHSVLSAFVDNIIVEIKVNHKFDSAMSPKVAYKLVMEAYDIKSRERELHAMTDAKTNLDKKQDVREVLNVSAFFLGELVKTWNSAQEASLELGIEKRNIIAVCEDTEGKNKSAGGYVWRYTTSDGEIVLPSSTSVFTGREKKLLTNSEYIPRRIKMDMQEYEREHAIKENKTDSFNLLKTHRQTDEWERKPLLNERTSMAIESKMTELLGGRFSHSWRVKDKVIISSQYMSDGLVTLWFYPNKARMILRFTPYDYGNEQTDEYKRFAEEFEKVCRIIDTDRIGSDVVFVFDADND